jgi:hypothetical protein
MCALTTPKDFIARHNAHKVFTVILHIMQMTQAMNLLEAMPKTVFDISYDLLARNMAIILSIYTLHLRRLVSSWNHGWQFERNISIESNHQEFNFLKRYLVIIQILQLVGGMFRENHSMEVRNNRLNTIN